MTFENDKERVQWISIVREGMFKYEPYQVSHRPPQGGFTAKTVTPLEQAIEQADAFIYALRQREKDTTND